jgi:hypothetical protein
VDDDELVVFAPQLTSPEKLVDELHEFQTELSEAHPIPTEVDLPFKEVNQIFGRPDEIIPSDSVQVLSRLPFELVMVIVRTSGRQNKCLLLYMYKHPVKLTHQAARDSLSCTFNLFLI